jgi:SAM-dependent methyltransferase
MMFRNTTLAPGECITACRSCGGARLESILDLGTTPLADRLPQFDHLAEPELVAPLEVLFCTSCTLVQIGMTVAPDVLFGQDYPYYSSVSDRLLQHFRESALTLLHGRGLGPSSLVVEAASNDGYMLRNFLAAGVPVLGIDPAPGPAQAARDAGIPTLGTFFTRELARDLHRDGVQADVFLANNVLAHVADLNGFVEGIGTLLAPDGVAVLECPYLIDLVDHVEFDTIYHQHLCYFSVHALDALFRRHGLCLGRVDRIPIHGGSLRLFVTRRETGRETRRSSTDALLALERQRGADTHAFYANFATRVSTLRSALLRILDQYKADGSSIVGYGAAAKACTLLNVCGIDERHLDYIVDKNPHKHGRTMSGTRLRIESTDGLLRDQPDATLVLAWNFADEIIAQQDDYRRRGGRFIVPVPSLRVVR